MWRQRCGSAMVTLVLLVGASGCEESDCAAGCPKLGQAATTGDVQLALQTDTSFGHVEVDHRAFDVRFLGGELVLRPEPDCVASQDHPCSVEIRRLEIRPSGFTTGDGIELSQIRLGVATPLEVVDEGLGITIDEGTTVHTCLTFEGDSNQYVPAPSESVTVINYDDRAGIQLASVEGIWPIAFADVSRDCHGRSARLTIVATFDLP